MDNRPVPVLPSAHGRRPRPAPAPGIGPGRRRAAWIVAVGADFLQIVLFPIFLEGALSPVNDVLDVIVSIALFGLLGWNPILLPALAAELIPGLDLVPTWTATVFLITRMHRPKAKAVREAGEAEVIEERPPGPSGGGAGR